MTRITRLENNQSTLKIGLLAAEERFLQKENGVNR